ncbi:MAG: hypothetical protein WD055_02700 [Candidatus Dependentiae bacterium]
MTKQTVQKGIVFSLVMSAGILLADSNLPDGVSSKDNIEIKNSESNTSLWGRRKFDPKLVEDIKKFYPDLAKKIDRFNRDQTKLVPNKIILRCRGYGFSKRDMIYAMASMIEGEVEFVDVESDYSRFKYNFNGYLQSKIYEIGDKLENSDVKIALVMDELLLFGAKCCDKVVMPADLWMLLRKYRGRFILIGGIDLDIWDDLDEHNQHHFGQSIYDLKKTSEDHRVEIIKRYLSIKHSMSDEQIRNIAKQTEYFEPRVLEDALQSAISWDFNNDKVHPTISYDQILCRVQEMKKDFSRLNPGIISRVLAMVKSINLNK